jgi:hypothetical protein
VAASRSEVKMANQQLYHRPSKRSWIILCVIALIVAVVVGEPLGVVAVLYTWTEWTLWAVPVVLGVVVFAIGATILTFNTIPGP